MRRRISARREREAWRHLSTLCARFCSVFASARYDLIEEERVDRARPSPTNILDTFAAEDGGFPLVVARSEIRREKEIKVHEVAHTVCWSTDRQHGHWDLVAKRHLKRTRGEERDKETEI